MGFQPDCSPSKYACAYEILRSTAGRQGHGLALLGPAGRVMGKGAAVPKVEMATLRATRRRRNMHHSKSFVGWALRDNKGGIC